MQGMSLAFSYDEAKDASPNNHHANYDELRKYIFILILGTSIHSTTAKLTKYTPTGL
jgi:hypothetical protein